MHKKIIFLTGTRADFGKLKSLIQTVDTAEGFIAQVFVTGMHMLEQYGSTAIEVEKCGFSHVYKFSNQHTSDSMDNILAKTIQGFSKYVKVEKPDLIVVHGDRVETLAGAIVGSLNNILVAHIEGGEVSGTIDELIRHSVSKLSHTHFVANVEAKQRLIQLGESANAIYTIGSPDLDIMTSQHLPSLKDCKARYDITFERYALFMYHPVTTELDALEHHIQGIINSIIESQHNYIIVYPNNDHGSDIIINALDKLSQYPQCKVFPSIRFEYFLSFLKHADFILGNSSAGVREAPFYGLPSINIGSRQHQRASADSIFNVTESTNDIVNLIHQVKDQHFPPAQEFGTGNSHALFFDTINTNNFWATPKQKVFCNIG